MKLPQWKVFWSKKHGRRKIPECVLSLHEFEQPLSYKNKKYLGKKKLFIKEMFANFQKLWFLNSAVDEFLWIEQRHRKAQNHQAPLGLDEEEVEIEDCAITIVILKTSVSIEDRYQDHTTEFSDLFSRVVSKLWFETLLNGILHHHKNIVMQYENSMIHSPEI